MAESQWDPLRDMEELLARYGRSAAVQPLAHVAVVRDEMTGAKDRVVLGDAHTKIGHGSPVTGSVWGRRRSRR